MKVLKKSDIMTEKEEGRIITEKMITQSISSPYIVKLHYAFQTTTKLYFVLDFMNGGDLFYHILNKFKFKEKKVIKIAAQVLLGLKCLHENNIIYRDLKPMNILLDKKGNVKLTDFGLSKMNFHQQDNVRMSMWGTVQYLAPEIAIGNPYNETVDWWSFGVIIYEMLSGHLPFDHKDKHQLMRDIVSRDFKFHKSFSKPAKDLLEKLLQKEPKKRLGANGVEEIMRHEFFKSIDWSELIAKELTQFLVKPPRGYKKYCYGRSNGSSVFSHDEAQPDRKIPNFTYIEAAPLQKFESAL